MSVTIGSARIDEHGKASGGAKGDQKQKTSPDYAGEVSMQNFYISSKGWYVLRPLLSSHALSIASCMVAACNNPHIGYSQSDRTSLALYGIHTTTDVNCDCSSLVRQCVKEGTGTDPGSFNTSNEATILLKTGLFSPKFEYRTGVVLRAGDILVTKSKGHTAIVVSTDGKVVDAAAEGNFYEYGMEGNWNNIPEFSNSSLPGYINRISSDSDMPRTSLVTCITIHIANTIGDIKRLSQLINTMGKGYHYGIDNNGTIGLFLDESVACIGTGDAVNDNRAVQIMLMNKNLAPNYEITDKCKESLVDLCEDICRRNFIYKLVYNNNNPEKGTITLHSQFGNKSESCPGPYIKKILNSLINSINERIKANSDNWVTVTHHLADSETSALRVQNTVSLGAIKPYVAKIDSGLLNVDYQSLKKLGVVGAMFDAGYLFDKLHNKVKYSLKSLGDQIKESSKAYLPFGLIFTTRATSIQEAANEARQLRSAIFKYSPKLGIWLHLDFRVVDTTLASDIIERFYSSFVDWGLKSRCGIYATKEKAQLIGWPNQCSYMPLWLEGEMAPSVVPSDEILTPSFFKLNSLENINPELQTSATAGSSQSGAAGAIVDGSIQTTIEGSASKVKKVTTDNYIDITVPQNSQYTGFKSFESYTSVTDINSQAYQIINSKDTVTDEQGFRTIGGRYLIAVGTGICNQSGTWLDVYIDGGAIIPCITSDQKADRDTIGPEHIFQNTSSRCCSEFVVDRSKLIPLVNKMGDCSYRSKDWAGKVIKFRVYTKNWFADRSN